MAKAAALFPDTAIPSFKKYTESKINNQKSNKGYQRCNCNRKIIYVERDDGKTYHHRDIR